MKAIMISDAMETGTVQINSAPARGPDHFPFQVGHRMRFRTPCSSTESGRPGRNPCKKIKKKNGFLLQGLKDSGIGSQGITNSINMMTKVKSTVINLPSPSYTMG